MMKFRILYLLIFSEMVFADTVTQGSWDLVSNNNVITSGLASEADCVDLALTQVPGNYQCRSETLITVDEQADEQADDDTPVPTPPSEFEGIPHPATVLGFDPYADYDIQETFSGSYNSINITRSGTAEAPYVIDARNATFTKVSVRGAYVMFIGGRVNAQAGRGDWFGMGSCDFCVAKDVDVAGPGVFSGNSSAVFLGQNTAWIGGAIHGFGDRFAESENDFHGIKVCGPYGVDTNVFVLNARIYHNSGDSVQAGDASRCEANNVYIGGGEYFDNRENAVDIKDSHNVVVSGVTMHGFVPTNTDPGSAIVIHDDAFNARIINNTITQSRIGIVSSGVSGHEIRNNTINTVGDGNRGIECRNTTDVLISDNTIESSQPIANSNCRGTILP